MIIAILIYIFSVAVNCVIWYKIGKIKGYSEGTTQTYKSVSKQLDKLMKDFRYADAIVSNNIIEKVYGKRKIN
jgi:hypothetical protein